MINHVGGSNYIKLINLRGKDFQVIKTLNIIKKINPMKKLFAFLLVILLTATIFAQSPEKMSYQALIRNSSDVLVTNTNVSMQISILQGSASGTAVYVERQFPATNANGLVNIEIGNGTVMSGNFTVIDWAIGPYFIKTEIDPICGTNYTITGVSQLLSVPYALYAKTAESITGNFSVSHYVGELFGGGVVFWVDHSGQHGLIVSMIDLSTKQAWSNVKRTLIGNTNDWDGTSNTTVIISQGGHTSSAAKLCKDYMNADYGTGIYNDWYLPSIAELNHVWNNFNEMQKTLENDGNVSTSPLTKIYYWTSTEDIDILAYIFDFSRGYMTTTTKESSLYVRAVRSF